MAEKRFDKRERIINDIERFVNADIAKAEDDREMTLLEEVVRIYDKTVEAIHASSTLGPRFIGGLYDLQNLHFDGCDDDCKCYSFRFDIDNGYFLDASCIWRWRPFHNFIRNIQFFA